MIFKNNSIPARISLVVIGLMWVLPFLQPLHPAPIPGFYTELLAFALGMAGVSLLLLKRYWNDLSLPQIVLGPIGLIAVLLLQLALGKVEYQEQVLLASLYLLWAALLMLLGSVLRRELSLATVSNVLAWFLLAGGMLSVLIGVLQHYQIHSFLDKVINAKNSSAVFGNLAQANHFADYIGLSLASLAYLCAVGKIKPYLTALFVLPLLFVLALSGSRSAWLYLITLAVLATWFYLRNRADAGDGKFGGNPGRKLMIVAWALIPAFVLMQWLAQTAWLAAPVPVITSSDRLFDLASGNSIRFYLWHEAWLMFLQSPLLGVGFGQFAWNHFQFLALFRQPEVSGLYNHAHNIVMQLLAETGLVGITIFFVALAAWLLGLRRRVFDIQTWWILALLSIVGIHSMLEFPLWYMHFLGIVAVLLGVGEMRLLQIDMKRFGRVSVGLILILGSISGIQLTQSYDSLRGLLIPRSYAQLNVVDAIEIHRILQQIHRESLFAPYIELAYSNAIILNQINLDDKLDLNGRAMRFAPMSAVVYRQAALLALKGEHDAAAKQMDRAMLAYPGDFEHFAKTVTGIEVDSPGTFGPLVELVDRKMKELERDVRAK